MDKIVILSFLLLLLFFGSAMGQNSKLGKICYSFRYRAGLIQTKEEKVIPKVHRDMANFLEFRIEKRMIYSTGQKKP